MLGLAFTEQLRKIGRALYAVVKRRRAPSSNAEQGLKGGYGLLSAIVPKDELVQVNLELTAAHVVVCADKPLLQVTNGPRLVGKDGRAMPPHYRQWSAETTG